MFCSAVVGPSSVAANGIDAKVQKPCLSLCWKVPSELLCRSSCASVGPTACLCKSDVPGVQGWRSVAPLPQLCFRKASAMEGEVLDRHFDGQTTGRTDDPTNGQPDERTGGRTGWESFFVVDLGSCRSAVVGRKFVPFPNKLHKENLWKPERTLTQARPANPPRP